MKKLFYRRSCESVVLVLIVAVLVGGCASTPPQEPAPQSGGSSGLTGTMQGLAEQLEDLLPLAADSSKFNDPNRRSEIEKKVQGLHRASKNVVHNSAIQRQDPSLRFLSTAFDQDINRVLESLKAGKSDFARYELMNLSSYCIECHTRTSSGPSIGNSRMDQALGSLNRMDRIEFLVATRKFEAAMKEIQSLIKTPNDDPNRFLELDRAVRYGLAIAVRFDQSPQKSLDFVRTVRSAERVPYFLRQAAEAWEVSIKDWQKEPKTNRAEGLAGARVLMSKGRTTQLTPNDRSGDIYFLRALSVLHRVLARDLPKDELGEALLLTGAAYESIRDLAVWSLHEEYYEACIQQVPKTRWSLSCYKRLEQAVYFGFSGSSGVHIPMDVQMRMERLKKLAN